MPRELYRSLVDAGMNVVYVNNYGPDRHDYFTGYRCKEDIFQRLKERAAQIGDNGLCGKAFSIFYWQRSCGA